ncbi:hypothetical protein QCA50_011220 [Cerrena zonata]|uniref:Uncharacterized protein n=1 Tax=Cerrena zonata TaxID=2478898 RepID=A0AAW0FXT7_9APHY
MCLRRTKRIAATDSTTTPGPPYAAILAVGRPKASDKSKRHIQDAQERARLARREPYLPKQFGAQNVPLDVFLETLSWLDHPRDLLSLPRAPSHPRLTTTPRPTKILEVRAK